MIPVFYVPAMTENDAESFSPSATKQAKVVADQWVADYHEYRPHESLGDVPAVLFKPRVFTAEDSTS